MSKRWALPSTRSTPELFIKRCLIRPIHVMLILAGLALLLSAAQMHAYTPSSSNVFSSVSTQELFLQPDSELPVDIIVNTPYGKPVNISFSTEYPSHVLRVDGELHSISTSFPTQREMRVYANWNAPQGDYLVTLRVHIQDGAQSFTETHPIRVSVGEKGLLTYYTTPHTTFPARVSAPVFSTNTINLSRTERTTVSVSFLNSGSATDYLIRLTEPSLNLSVHIVNETHRLVEDGSRVTSWLDITARTNSPFGETPLYVEAYNLVSGEKTLLGVVRVNVYEKFNLAASLPFQSFVVEENDSLETLLTLENTEYSDVDVVIESSSSLAQPSHSTLRVPAKTTITVPLSIRASPSLGVRSDAVYILNPNLTEQVSFTVETVPRGTLKPIVPDENASGNGLPFTPISGFVSGVFSSVWGVVIILLAGLIVFSQKFRDGVVARLPKPVPPAKAPPVPKPTPAAAPSAPAPDKSTPSPGIVSNAPVPSSKSDAAPVQK